MQEQNSPDLSLNNARVTVAIFSSTMAITLAIVYYLARIDFGDYSVLPIVKVLSISFFLIFLPQGRRFLPKSLHPSFQKSWLSTDASIFLIGLIILTLSSSLVPVLGLNLLPLFACIGFALFIVTHTAYWRGSSIKANIIFITASMLFSLWVGGVLWGSEHMYPLFRETIIIGYTNIDALFHASISNMLKTYGMPSTGLDGLPYVSYHYGSHWLFAQLSNLLDFSTVEFYQLGFPVVFAPIWFFSSLSFTIHLREYLISPNISWNLRSDCKFWLILFIAYIGFIPLSIEYALTTGWRGHLSSQSYVLAVSCSFFLMSLALSFFTNPDTREENKKKEGWIFWLVIFPLLIGLIGFFKIAIMFLLFCLCVYLFIRLKLYRYKIFNFSFLFTVLIFISVYNLTKSVGFEPKIGLFYDINIYVKTLWKPLFFILYFFWFWLFIILKLREKNVKTLADMKTACIKNTILDVEMILVMGLVGIIPSILLVIPAGAGYFFSDFQTWLSLSFLLANLEKFK